MPSDRSRAAIKESIALLPAMGSGGRLTGWNDHRSVFGAAGAAVVAAEPAGTLAPASIH